MKVWQVRIKANVKRGKTIKDVADKDITYYAQFQYKKSKKGNWSMTHDYATEQLYAGLATTATKAIIAALKCAKKDDIEKPEVITVVRLGNCDFRS